MSTPAAWQPPTSAPPPAPAGPPAAATTPGADAAPTTAPLQDSQGIIDAAAAAASAVVAADGVNIVATAAAAASAAAASAPPSDATALLIQQMQAQQQLQHASITSITNAVGQGATKVAALTDLLQTQMRDLTTLSASVADLGTGQTALVTSMADLNRKLDLLLTSGPATTRRTRPAKDAAKDEVVDLVSMGAPAAQDEGTHHSEAPAQKHTKHNSNDSGTRPRSASRAADGH